MKRTRFQSAFTLLELVLVMMIVCIALGVAAAKLGGWTHGSKLRNSSDELIGLTRLAKTRAVTEGRIYRLKFDASGKFWLQAQQSVVPMNSSSPNGMSSGTSGQGIDDSTITDVDDNFGGQRSVPEGGKIEVTKAAVNSAYANSNADSIDFYPTGRTQAARITITDAQGYWVDIVCDAPAENFRWDSEGSPR